MRVSDEKARAFYAEECAKSAWSVRQLERQINTMYYQWILASQDKASVAAEIQRREPKPEYEKNVKDPYVMEFLQIQPDTHVYESDLEQALIDHHPAVSPENWAAAFPSSPARNGYSGRAEFLY